MRLEAEKNGESPSASGGEERSNSEGQSSGGEARSKGEGLSKGVRSLVDQLDVLRGNADHKDDAIGGVSQTGGTVVL